MSKLKLLIADDQKLFADSLKTVLLGQQAMIESVHIVMNGKEAIAYLGEHDIDVILMDIHMPVLDGIEATKYIKEKSPGIKILMLTTFGYDKYVKASIGYGAEGFLLKDISAQELISSINAVCNGLKIISPSVIDGAYMAPRSSEELKKLPGWFYELTHREKEILVLVQQGFSNEEITGRVFLSTQTVKNYLSSIYEKMDVKNRFQAMRLAMEYKLVARSETDFNRVQRNGAD